MAVARADLAGDEAHLETDLPQQQGKQRVQLITETAAVTLDHLAEQRLRRQLNTLMTNNAQVLERDAQHVAMVQLLQRGEVRAGAAGKADMLQVALGIHRMSRMRTSRHNIAGFAAF
ncbi:hypothetical protein MPER_15707, partial [Moniliophthora perniciosa FA553]